MELPATVASFTAILRPPVTEPGRTRRWSAHCLDLDMGVSAESASAVRARLASTIAQQIALEPWPWPSRRTIRRPAANQALWAAARTAPLVTRQTVETDVGPVEVCYVLPTEDPRPW